MDNTNPNASPTTNPTTNNSIKPPGWKDTEPSQPPEPLRVRFDRAALQTMREAAADVIAIHPEVRSCLIVLDYEGELNRAGLDKVALVGQDGPVTSLGVMFETMSNVQQVQHGLVDAIAAQAEQLRRQIRDDAEKLKQKDPDGKIPTTQKETNAEPEPAPDANPILDARPRP